MRNIDKLKQYCKTTAKSISKTRLEFKEAQRKSTDYYVLHSELNALIWIYRHHHIVYCELRGKTRKQIERKNRENNKPNDSEILRIKDRYMWTPEEIISYEERKVKNEGRKKAICVA